MFVRRRPLLRAAVVGGGAYVAGKRSAQRSQQRWSQQQSMQPSVPQQQGGEMGQEPTTPSVSDQLAQLSTLHAQGSLSDAEFAAAKSRLLAKLVRDPIALRLERVLV